MSESGKSRPAGFSAGSITRSLALTAVVLCLAGCTQLGPDLVKAGRNDYNIIIKQTEDEEAILNLVRVRYGDGPMFLDVNSISTSFVWTQSASGRATIYDRRGSDFQRSNLGITGNIEYTERPTITYTPLGGRDFVKSVLTPSELDTLVLLSNSGWSVDRLFRIMVNRMNGLANAPRASGPTPGDAPVFKEFRRATRLMRQLQVKGMLRIGYQKRNGANTPVLRIAQFEYQVYVSAA